MKTKISKEVMTMMAKLSTEWNNTGYAVVNKDGSISASVWNNWKWEKGTPEERQIVARCNGNDGWKIIYEAQYEWEVETDVLMEELYPQVK